MQLIHENQNSNHHEKDNVTFLPIIDLDPTDMSCILSTLSFLSNLAKQNNQTTIVAFDQPLYLKRSRIILESADHIIQQIVLLIGNFHTNFNLLGWIGFLMADTGLKSILSEIYAECTVAQMLSGKAYARPRALRGHLIVDQVLSSIMFEKMIDCYNLNKDEVIKSLDIVSSKINISDFENDSFMKSVDLQMSEARIKINHKSRTPTLWSEYQNIIQVIRKLITADRTGNWNLHLEGI